MSNRIPVLERIIEIVETDDKMKGDEAQVWIALGSLWEIHGVDYSPPIRQLMAVCKRSRRFVLNALKKLRDRLFIAAEHASYTPGAAFKSAECAPCTGANNALVQNVHPQSADNAPKVQNVPLQSAQCASEPKSPKRPYIESSPEGRFLSNITTSESPRGRARAQDGIKISTPKSEQAAFLDPEEAGAQQSAYWTNDGQIIVANGFRVELKKHYPDVTLCDGLGVVAGEQSDPTTGNPLRFGKALMQAIRRKFSYLQNEHRGRDKRAAEASRRNSGKISDSDAARQIAAIVGEPQ